MVVIVAIGNAPRTGRTSADDRYALRDRVAFVDEVARRLRPHYLLPEPPDGDDGGRSLETREELLARSAVVAHAVSGRIHVGLAVRPSVAADSALYAWAAPPDSPVDAIGFAIVAGFGGASTIDGQLATAARWMRTTAAGGHPVWIWSAATAPVAHGDASQTWALRGMLAWATSHAAVRGLIVSDAGDYTERSGLRSASGRLRPAVELLTRAIDDLTETRATPAPGPAPPAPTLVATPIPKR